MIRSLIVFWIILTISFPAPIFAREASPTAGPYKMAVIAVDVPKELLDRRGLLRDILARTFEKDARVRLIPLDEIAQWKDKDPLYKKQKSSPEELKDARDLLTKGKEGYQTLRFKQAVDALEQAREQFILYLPFLRSNRDLIQAHLFLGMSYLALKKEKKADQEFERVVYLDPKRELSGRDYSPTVRKAFSRVKQNILQQDSVRVRIESLPSGAFAYLNGRALGKTPLRLKLQPGEYFVLVEKKGMKDWYQPIRLEKRVNTVRAMLKPDVDDLRWATLFRVREGKDRQSRDLKEVLDIAQGIDAKYVVLATLTQPKQYRLLGQLFSVQDQMLSQAAVITLGDSLKAFPSAAQDMAQTLLGFIQTDGRLTSAPSLKPELPSQALTVGGQDRPKPSIFMSPPPKKKWYENWWIYPLLVGAGVGIFFGVREIGGSGGSKVVIDNSGNF